MIDPKRNLFRWGPADCRLIFPDYWHIGFVKFSREFRPGWPPVIEYFKDEKATCIVDSQTLYGNGEKIFKKFILNDNLFKKNYSEWEEVIFEFKKFYEEIKNKKLNRLGNKEFADLFFSWNKFYGLEFWNIGCLPELANWGGEQILNRELGKRIKNEKDFNRALERLSSPEDFSFYQKEELDLLSLKKIKDKRLLEEKLKKHQQKYFWLLNSYHHTQILPVSYFRNILTSYSLVSARQKLKEIGRLRKKAIEDKKKIISKFKFPKNILKIGRRLAFCVWWQDLRKAYIFQANYIIDLFLKEISRRHKTNFENLHFYNVREIESLAGYKKYLPQKEINARKNHILVYYSGTGHVFYHSGKKAEKIFKPFKIENVDKNIKEFKGLAVSRGKANGMVKIILGPEDFSKMKKGDILASPMTTPDFIVVLRKSSAIITDEGGMTCHAAIVSRELKIPCIVGTKIATKVLKDGDLVGVDANKGIVRILKK